MGRLDKIMDGNSRYGNTAVEYFARNEAAAVDRQVGDQG